MSERKWYYIKDNIKMGPVPEETLKKMFQSGELDKDTLVWSDMLTEWFQASKLEVFKREIATRAIPYAPEPPSQPPAKKKMSKEIKIAIVVGIVGMVVVFILGVFFLSWLGGPTNKSEIQEKEATKTGTTTPTETELTTQEKKEIEALKKERDIEATKSTIKEAVEKEIQTGTISKVGVNEDLEKTGMEVVQVEIGDIDIKEKGFLQILAYQVLRAIYTSGASVSVATASFRTSDDIWLFKVILREDKANGINWDTLKQSEMNNLWEVAFISPQVDITK